MARLSKAARRKRKSDILIASVLLTLVVLVAGGTGYYFMTRPDGINPTTLCPASGPEGHVILLVDLTDPMTFTQRAAFDVTVRDLVRSEVPEGYLFSVFTLGENFKTSAEPVLELCNPGTGADKSRMTANVDRLKRQYQEKFLSPLLEQSKALQATTPAKASPIFEMLQLVGINGFRKQGVQGPKKLVMMSDMLHNTSQFSMYKGRPEFSVFRDSDYGRRAQADLSGVTVELHYLVNYPKLQTRANLKFWEDYFEKAGARITAVRPMEG